MTDWGREIHVSAGDGTRLFARESGIKTAHKPSLLCLPGMTRNSKDFKRVVDRLKADWHLISPDYRGRGRSDDAEDSSLYVPETYLSDLRHLLIAQGVHRVCILGTSMGGLLAMGLAAMAPSSVAGVLMNDVGPDVPNTGLGPILDYLSTDQTHADAKSAQAALQATFPHLPCYSQADWDDMIANTFKLGRDGRLHRDWDQRLVEPLKIYGGLDRDLWPLFRGLRRIPVAVIRGEKSTLLTPETVHKMADAHSNLTSTQVPNVGHAPNLDEPNARKAIDDLLQRI